MAEIITQCVYCGIDLTAETLSRDHVIPKVRGGYRGERNIAPACLPCNQAKGPLTASEYMSVRDDAEDLAALKRIVLAGIPQAGYTPPKPTAPPPSRGERESARRQVERERSTLARKMQRDNECILALGFTICTCSVCHPERNSKALAMDRFALQQEKNRESRI